jgi:hypothetical protein
MVRHIPGKCVQNLLRCGITDSSLRVQTDGEKIGSGSGTKIPVREQEKRSWNTGSDLSMRKTWRIGRKLLVLRPCRQGFVDFGMVNHFGKKLLAERRQSAFP